MSALAAPIFDRSPSGRYVACLIASASVHAMLAVGIGSGYLARALGPPSPPQRPKPTESIALLPPDPETTPGPFEVVKLGIEHSTALTETWLGFEDPSEHGGPPANLDQAALAPAPGDSSLDAPGAEGHTPPTEQTAAVPEELPTQRPPEPTPAEPPRSPGPTVTVPASVEAHTPPPQPIVPDESVLTPDRRETPDEPEISPTPIAFDADPRNADSGHDPQHPKPREPTPPGAGEPATSQPPASLQAQAPPPVSVSPAAPAASAQATPRRKVGDQPGQISEKEAVAAALKEAVDVKPGRPAAAEGLDIKTVAPRWSVTTRLTTGRPSWVVRVVFGREGKVILADFVKGQQTDVPALDEPLIDAVYRWRASGAALKKLPANDPKAGISVIFRISPADGL